MCLKAYVLNHMYVTLETGFHESFVVDVFDKQTNTKIPQKN